MSNNNFVTIETIIPPLGSIRQLVMLEPFTVSIRISTPQPIANLNFLRPEIWTNVVDKYSPSGEWHGIRMFTPNTNNSSSSSAPSTVNPTNNSTNTLNSSISSVNPIATTSSNTLPIQNLIINTSRPNDASFASSRQISQYSPSKPYSFHYSYQGSFFPTATGMFEFTVRVGVKKNWKPRDFRLMFSSNDSLNGEDYSPNSQSNIGANNNDFEMSINNSAVTDFDDDDDDDDNVDSDTEDSYSALSENEFEWVWGGKYGKNGVIAVGPPIIDMGWTHGPNIKEIADGVYVGNFIAACDSSLDGKVYDCVLNLAEELEVPIIIDGSTKRNIIYKKIGLRDGANHPIPESCIIESINWVKEQVSNGRRVCINCRAGIGRSGSMAIAYLFATRTNWSYKQALEAAWKQKKDIYPHDGLEQSLSKIFR